MSSRVWNKRDTCSDKLEGPRCLQSKLQLHSGTVDANPFALNHTIDPHQRLELLIMLTIQKFKIGTLYRSIDYPQSTVTKWSLACNLETVNRTKTLS
jgi:hypothetical protein